MGEGQQRRLPHVLGEHLRPPGPGGQRGRRTRHHDVGAHTVHLERRTGRRDLPQRPVAEPHRRQPLPRRDDPSPYGGFLAGPTRGELLRLVLIGQTSFDDLDALLGIAGGGDLDSEAEAVQQLGTQFAFLRVHGPDEQEPCGVPHGDALALDVGGAHGGGVQQNVNEVVMKQVDFIDVENAPVRGGEEAGFEGFDAFGKGPLDVQCPDEPVLGGADGQFDHAGGTRGGSARLVRGVWTGRVGGNRVAGEPASGYDAHLRQ